MNPAIHAEAPTPRNAAIDALRGLSILLVVLHHIALRIPLKETALADWVPRRVLLALNWNGYEAVFVFFVISGFLITTHALRRWGRLRDIDLRDFYVRRASRILPSLLALIAVLCALHAAGVDRYVVDGEGQTLSGTVLSALGLYLNWYEGMTGWLPGNWDVLWSLSVEEAFYVAFPLVCIVVRDMRVMAAVLVVLALSLPFTRAALESNEIWQEKAYLPGMAAIATGVLAAIWAHRRIPGERYASTLIWLGAAGLLAIFVFGDVLWKSLGNGMMLVLTTSGAALLVGLHARAERRPSRLFGWLREQGRLSYEIYLTHMFVVFTAVDLFKASGADMRMGHIWYLPIVLTSWALGALVARTLSNPAERALRTAWNRRKSAIPATAA